MMCPCDCSIEGRVVLAIPVGSDSSPSCTLVIVLNSNVWP